MEIERIESIIINTLEEVKDVIDNQNLDAIDANIKLFGKEGVLDSMGLVSLITELEEKIEDEFGISLTLADERAMSQKKSPFLTISSLAKYISNLIEKEKPNEKA